jgi:hypothetical protein
MQVCRRTAGKAAMMILTVDSEVPRPLLDRLADTEEVTMVSRIEIAEDRQG